MKNKRFVSGRIRKASVDRQSPRPKKDGMRRLRWFSGVAVAVVALALVAGAVPAGSQQPQDRRTLTFFEPERNSWERHIDELREGESPGDVFIFVNRVFDPETCELAGRLIGRLHVLNPAGPNDAWFLGDFTLVLADGKLTAGGGARFSEFSQADRGVFAITGGTDAHRDASGEVKFQEEVKMCDLRGTLFTVDIGPQP